MVINVFVRRRLSAIEIAALLHHDPITENLEHRPDLAPWAARFWPGAQPAISFVAT